MEMTKTQPITAERIESALNILARVMVDLGDEGTKCLPIYERLERELALTRSAKDKMASVVERARRSRDRTASQLPS